MRSRTWWTLLLLGGMVAHAAALTVAPPFTDHAILQRGQPVPIWGKARPGEKITVRFAGQEVQATADAQGRWLARLGSLTASSEGRDLTVQGDSLVTIRDVLVGEVWLCSGQSNMEYTLRHAPNLAQLLPESDLPTIRQFKVKNISSPSVRDAVEGSWTLCSPETAGQFTAVGYHFARALQRDLSVPIGLINASWGATRIQAWMSPEILREFPSVAEGWQKTLAQAPAAQKVYEAERVAFRQKAQEDKAAGRPVSTRYPKPPPGSETKEAPSGPYQGMLAPLIPYAIQGILWYQGEGNTGGAGSYAAMFTRMIEDFRARWQRPDLPFLFVQLPNFGLPSDKTGQAWAELRAAQAAALALPQTGMVVTLDVGMENEGHPPDKTQVGARLARLALVNVYHTQQGDAGGPIFRSARLEGSSVKVDFTQISSGLSVRGDTLGEFEVAGADGIFQPATATIHENSVLVQSPSVPSPRQIRYAWRNNPAATLYNGAGYPAAPFYAPVGAE